MLDGQVFDSEQVALHGVGEKPAGPVSKVRDLQPVGQHVVGIEADERVSVEKQRGESADEEHVISDHPHGPRLRQDPDDHAEGGEEDVHENSRRADHHPASA